MSTRTRKPATAFTLLLTAIALCAAPVLAVAEPTYKADVPDSITTPDEVKTRIGTLRFTDGAPDEETVRLVYDNLDFVRGVTAFLDGIPAASVFGMCRGFAEAGVGGQTFGIMEDLIDARSLILTPNSTTIYVLYCTDLEIGPLVVEAPQGVLGFMDDAYQRHVTDMGVTGPDEGKGGKYLFVPPGYDGALPEEGYFIVQAPSYKNWLLMRAFVKDGDIEGAVAGVKETLRVYPWAERDTPPATEFVNLSGIEMTAIHANDFEFYEEIDAIIQKEPADAFPPEFVGTLAAIGIKKGQPFAPDQRMRAILEDAVAVANATARAIIWSPPDGRGRLFEDRQWHTTFVGGNHEFYKDGERLLDARALFHYYAAGITPAMAAGLVGKGSQYTYSARDSEGRYLDGSKTYKITLPAPVPVNNFWSFMVYDTQSRAMLETDQRSAGLDSNKPDLVANEDESHTVWFAPEAPEGKEGNWVQTMPGKGWHSLFRLYGPLEPWFDRTWKPGDFELVE